MFRFLFFFLTLWMGAGYAMGRTSAMGCNPTVAGMSSEMYRRTESILGGLPGCLVSKDQQISNEVCRMLPGTWMTGRRRLPIRLLQATEVYDLRQVVEVVLANHTIWLEKDLPTGTIDA